MTSIQRTPSSQRPQQTQGTQQATPSTPATSTPQTTQTAQTTQTRPATTDSAAPSATAQTRADAQVTAGHDVTASQIRARTDGTTHSAGGVEGRGLNNSQSSMPSASGRIPSSAWDNPGPAILGNLRQNPPPGQTGSTSGPARCGPANVLATSIMQGPAATASSLRGVADHTPTSLSDAQRTQLRDIAGRVDRREASYEDLSTAQDILYRAGNTHEHLGQAVRDAQSAGLQRLNPDQRAEFGRLSTQMESPTGLTEPQARRMGELLTAATGRPSPVELVPDPHFPNDRARDTYAVRLQQDTSAPQGGFSDGEITTLARQTGRPVRTAELPGNNANPLHDVMAGLRPGETATVRVAGTEDGTAADHFVTMGRRQDGTPYIYNPDPAHRDHTLYVGHGTDAAHQPRDFDEQLSRYEDRVRLDRDSAPMVTYTGP